MWPIVDQFPIKAGWRDTPFVLRDFSQGNKQSWICHYENIDLSSWKFKPFNMKISTFQHENLDSSSWKSRSFIMKISTIYHENLGRSSWKSRPFIMKIWPFLLKISTVRNKILTVCNKIWAVRHENKSQLFPEMAFHTWDKNHLTKVSQPT